MAYQAIFKRYELKYMITKEQKARITEAISPYMAIDKYGHTIIRNIYFDTDSFLLIRRSIEKPVYKEKLRIRSYSKAEADTKVFVELKKKYKHVVYKRRIAMSEHDAMAWIAGDRSCGNSGQITSEIEYFMDYYKGLHPTVFLSYEREAFYSLCGDDFRVTFDENVLCRESDLSLESDVWGTPILDDDKVLMEIKCSGAVPLWMTQILSREKIYKTSFSKYGTAYRTLIYPKTKELYYA